MNQTTAVTAADSRRPSASLLDYLWEKFRRTNPADAGALVFVTWAEEFLRKNQPRESLAVEGNVLLRLLDGTTVAVSARSAPPPPMGRSAVPVTGGNS